jgi:H/ACA ribonucleoprotein complex non-core subunit NAF1
MDSYMDIEKPDVIQGARDTLPTEKTPQNGKDEQTHIHKAELPGPVSSTVNAPEEMQESPPLTSALEALLGGLDTPTPLETTAPAPILSSHDPMIQDEPTTKDSDASTEIATRSADTVVEDAPIDCKIPGLFSISEASIAVEDNGGRAPEATDAALDAMQEAPVDDEQGEHPEWEIDSSPIESSSDDSSDSDSSDESEEGENAYKLLSPEEQARILMQDDGGSDDEGDNKAKGLGSQLRTKNEIPEVVIPKPDVTITEAMPIQELGVVEGIVENILLIKANTSGEYRVLESGSVLCLPDRSVIGVVSETIGRVQQPFYSVLFTSPTDIKEAGLEVGTKVFYSEQHSTYVFTQSLKAFKGSDASNLHDEEVGDDEMEFSDDEAEAEHKRKVKQKRMEKRGGAQQNSSARGGMMHKNGPRGGHPLQQQHGMHDAGKALSYDDNDDGPYKPLARPAGYGDAIGRIEAPQEGAYNGGNDRSQNRDQFRGRGRGDRGDRGRSRGDRGRGRGRGGSQDRPSSNTGFSLPPQGQQSYSSPQFPGNFQQAPFQPFQQPAYSPPTNMSPNFFQQPQYSPQQPPMASWQQMLQQQSPWPSMPLPPPLPGLPGGAYLNPAFFNNQQQPGNQNQWNQQQKK